MCSKTKVQLILNEDIKPVHILDSSDWAAPIVVARKANGRIRLCADYSTGLNDALKDIIYPIPKVEDVVAKFPGNTIFSQLHLSDAHLQLRLDESSQKMTTISTHKGLFQYNRLVFGLKPAPAIFQKTVDQAPSGIEGTLVYLDDILIMGPDKLTYDQRLHAVLQRL
ncbi:unnamed protein product [Gongylonema pulchrum]|uniref:Reverse transcriptase domain-containing protein n=1 Tax=Gongylonema pulchrum TaxID=637853 RepID=A0A183DGS3_9BILA|nr:unnamed protein product [Gongylonema pulchrum]